ncbi:MAG: UDP-glucose 4-epimerase GalE [Cyclobacteriaceae bacterium]|nr:UDP-glucose 4-epimerase GalE [Cyclobacteriaceae bacterium]
MKKILVTGGAGYIGAHTVVELVSAGYEPVIIDNLSASDLTLVRGIEKITGRPVAFYQGDCRNRAFLEEVFSKEKFPAVMHFAALKSVGESVQKPLEYYDNNIGSLVALLDMMGKYRVTDFIFSSSCTVYGQPDAIPVTEETPFKKAESPYGATKQMCERILEDVSKNGLRVLSLRYFNPIGAHPSAQIGELPIGTPNNLVPFVTQTAAGVRPELVVFGNDYNTPDGSCIRDFIHVVDVARAHVDALQYLQQKKENRIYEVFNLGVGKGMSVLEIVNLFQQVTGVQLRYRIGNRRPGDVEKIYADPSRIMKELGWKPVYTIEQALLHAWQWQKKLSGLS